ncbi:MAG: NAD(+) synthase [Candidatus Hodarchaeales archaeon]
MYDIDISDNVDKISKKITNFLITIKEERGASGFLVLFSGYIDSTVVAKLCIDAVGLEGVKLLVRSERRFETQKEILECSIKFLEAEEKNIVHCDIEPMLKNVSSDNLIPGSLREVPDLYPPLSQSLLKSAMRLELEGTYGMVGEANSGREKLIHKIIAQNKLRSRLQMAVAYLKAETENLLLVGTINKTELQTGLFTKWGHGHCADIMPLGNLYRSQIIQIAEKLQIPEEIRSIAKRDLLPGIDDKYLYFFDLPAAEVDKILVRLENGLSIEEVSEQTGSSVEAIEKINHYIMSAAYTRAAPLMPKI